MKIPAGGVNVGTNFVPDAAVLSKMSIAPAVPPRMVMLAKTPGPVFSIVVVAEEMTPDAYVPSLTVFTGSAMLDPDLLLQFLIRLVEVIVLVLKIRTPLFHTLFPIIKRRF